jgi:prepilin-type N-terminal cleavage/methylation domain-containing protein
MNLSSSLRQRRFASHGFSLFEMVMTVAIIGILVSLTMPLLGSQHDAFSAVKARRNAQELVSECAAAQAADVNFVVPDDLAGTLANIRKGAVATSGAFNNRSFGLPNVTAAELQESAAFLQLSGTELTLRSSPKRNLEVR